MGQKNTKFQNRRDTPSHWPVRLLTELNSASPHPISLAKDGSNMLSGSSMTLEQPRVIEGS